MPKVAASKTAKPSLMFQLQRWHKLLSWCTGGMVLTIVGASKGRGLSKTEATKWIQIIREVADEIEETIK